MRFFLAAALLLSSAGVQARESPEWTYCDFGIDPKAGLLASKSWAEAGMQAGIAQRLYGRGARGFASLPQPRMEAATACTAALASPDLAPGDWTRRVSLLQASAAHRLAADDARGAMADLDAAVAAIPAGINPAERARTLDLGIAMLRGIAAARSGDNAGAVRLIATAADARPWSGQVQDMAINVLETLPGGRASATTIADRRLRLDDSGREPRAKARHAIGDFAGAFADWKLVKPAVTEPTTIIVPMPGVFVGGTAGWPMKLIDSSRVGAAGLAAAFAGDAATARAWLAEARANAAAAPVAPALVLPKGLTGPAFPTVDKAAQDAAIARQSALVEAAILFQAGKTADARAALVAIGPLDDRPATLQAIGRITGQPVPETTASGKVEPRLLFAMLPRYEGSDTVGVTASESPVRSMLLGGLTVKKPRRNSYSGSVGFFKAAGFKAKPMKTGEGTTITFTGDASSSFAVEEMTLLRAAELALEAGKPRLLILDKRDYQRTSQMTINGSPRGEAVPAGFQTELDVVFTDAADERAIAAADVVAGLGPIYKP